MANKPVDIPAQKDKLSPVQRMIGTTVRSSTTLNERLTERLKDRLPEGVTEVPPVRLHIRLGPHGHAGHHKDLPGLLKRENAKVYCHENTDGDNSVAAFTQLSREPIDNNDKAAVNNLVNSTTVNGKPIHGTTWEAQVRAIAGTNIAIGHFDMRPNKGDPDPRPAVHVLEAKLTLSELGDTLDGTLQIMHSAASELATPDRQRDELMLGPSVSDDGSVTAGRFEDEMVRIFTENPGLLCEPEVVVLDTHGAAHTSMSHRADAAGVDVTRSFFEVPFVYSPAVELVRKVAIGKEPTREFLVQCFADSAMRNALERKIPLSTIGADSDVVRYFRMRSVAFDEADAEKVFKTMQQGGARGVLNKIKGAEHTISTINKILLKKGLGPLPQSSKEMYADIAKHADDLAEKKAKVQAESDARRAKAAKAAEEALKDTPT
jgi:hypothetical protein